MEAKEISKKTLLNYSLIAIPLSVLGLPLYLFLPTFYVTEVGVDIALVGAMIFIARVTDVFTDPYVGYLSDRSLKRFGTRKPVMMIGSFLLIISFYFIINPSATLAHYWLFLFSFFIYLGWSMVSIPYITWSSELSSDYYQKTKLNSFREVATILGLLLALIVPYFFASEMIQSKLNTLFIFFIVLFIPFFAITFKTIKPIKSSLYKPFDINEFKTIYQKIPSLKNLQIGYFLNNFANAIPATLFLLFTEFVIQAKEYTEIILILYFASGVIALPFWTLLSKKIGKKLVWIASIILASSSFSFVLFLGEGDVLYFTIISFISGLSLGADIAFPTAIQGDIVEKTKQSHHNMSGLLFGVWTMITKFALAISVVFTFGILGLFEFDKEAITEKSLLVLTLLYGLAPILLKFGALLFIRRYNDSFEN